MAAVKRFRAKPMYLNSQRLHPNGRWTSDMRLKRLQTAAMVVMVIFYPKTPKWKWGVTRRLASALRAASRIRDGGQRVENAAQKYLASRAQRGFPLPRAVSPVAPLSQTLNKKTVKESPSVLLSRPPPRTRAPPERRADEPEGEILQFAICY